MELVTSWEPYWLEASHWYSEESSSPAEERLKISEEDVESDLWISTPPLFSSSTLGGAPSERQVSVTC